MSKQSRINAGLFGLIILLSIFLSLSEHDGEQTLPPLSDIGRNSINKIEIIRKDLDDFIFYKQDAAWYMQSPLQYRANTARIDTMLRLLETESYAQIDPKEHPLERFDLKTPVIAIKFNEYEFLLGGTDAIDQRRYVLFNNKVHLSDDFLYQQLTTNAAFYADTKLLPDSFTISAMAFPENRIEKVDDVWKTQRLMDISPDQLQHLVQDWQDSSALSVSLYQQAEKQEEEKQIILYGHNAETVTFVIVGTESHLILGRKDIGLQYHMGSDAADNLLLKENPAPDALLEKTVE